MGGTVVETPSEPKSKRSVMSRALQQSQKPDQEKETKAQTEVAEPKAMTEQEMEFQKMWQNKSTDEMNKTVPVDSETSEEVKSKATE